MKKILKYCLLGLGLLLLANASKANEKYFYYACEAGMSKEILEKDNKEETSYSLIYCHTSGNLEKAEDLIKKIYGDNVKIVDVLYRSHFQERAGFYSYVTGSYEFKLKIEK